MKNLFIIRGIPGCGKSTFAEFLKKSIPGHLHFENDDLFYDKEGNYIFSFSLISRAVQNCYDNVEGNMMLGKPSISVGNTFTKESHVQKYIKLAENYGYKVTCLVVENRHGGIDTKGVPEETLINMEKGLRNSLKLR
jgi:predicted kinase